MFNNECFCGEKQNRPKNRRKDGGGAGCPSCSAEALRRGDFPQSPALGGMEAGNQLIGGQFPLAELFFAHCARHAVPEAGQGSVLQALTPMKQRGQNARQRVAAAALR